MKETYAAIEKNVKLIRFAARIEKEGHPRLLTRVYFDPEGSFAKWIAQANAQGRQGASAASRKSIPAGSAWDRSRRNSTSRTGEVALERPSPRKRHTDFGDPLQQGYRLRRKCFALSAGRFVPEQLSPVPRS